MIRSILILLLLSAQFCGLGPKIQLPEPIPGQDAPKHEAWDSLLRKHVDEEGMVDYRGFEKDRELLQEYLNDLASHIPSDYWSREEKLAYYINLYNAGTVMLILDNYPLESIKDIWNPWGKDRLKIGSSTYSLNDIEPRIHFAVNCASFSCPKLRTEAFRADVLEEQLETATRDFINDPERNQISEDRAELSRIFKWYGEDFEAGDRDVLDFINRYLPQPLLATAEIDYLTYDWSLNES